MIKKFIWGASYVAVFLVVFVASAVLKVVIPSGMSNELNVPWNDSVGAVAKDIAYGPEPTNKFDLYMPADRTKPTYGLVVYIHAGGFRVGDKSEDAPWLKYFTSKGYLAAGVNYSLRTDANEVSITQMSEEIRSSIPAIKAEAAKRGYRIDRMAVGGGSAGGALAMIFAYRDARTSPIPVAFLFQAVGPASFEPALWGAGGEGYLTDEAASGGAAFASMMTGQKITPEMMRNGQYRPYVDNISACSLVRADAPPSILAYGVHDKLVPYRLTPCLRRALRREGIPHDFIEFPRSGHGLHNDPDAGRLYFQRINEYLNRYMPVAPADPRK